MYNKVDANLNFVEREKEVVDFWQKNDILNKMIVKNKDGKLFSFYEGPPTANGKPHIGHVLTRTIKDLFLRYHTMKGENVLRKAGWDTHGLPVELEVEKQIGSTGKQDIEKYGVEPFIAKCKENVWLYKDMWEKFSARMGYTADPEHPYITYDNNYIESVWWSLSELHKKGYLYKGYRVRPYCPRCATSLSSHEVAQGYKDVKEKSVFVRFKKVGEENTYFLAWTTTPWTLPSNVALAMNPNETYVKLKDGNDYYIMAQALIHSLFKEGEYEIVEERHGKEYEYAKYIPLFNFAYEKNKDKAFFVTMADYVTLTDGTGIVHIAPAFGEDDSEVGKRYNLPFVQLLDEKGCLTAECEEFTGVFAKDADPLIIKRLKAEKKLVREMQYEHSYPFCWRCGTPLLYYAGSSWFVAVTKAKDKLIENNNKIDWRPDNVRDGRMGGFLRSLIDWDLGRKRYWGTPLPIWTCECGHEKAVGSIAELKKLGNIPSGQEIDLHKPFVDKITFKCEKCGKTMTRVPEVIDCWYDSGSMPFAQYHYPFENKELFEKAFPAEYISEGMDQTRGWFYSLLAINTLLFGKSPYKRCLPLGLVNDEFGKKMSKSLGNVVTPWEVFDKQGADAVRWYFYSANAPWLSTNFKKETMEEYQRKTMGTLWNTYAFYILYANIDKFDGSKHKIDSVKLSMLDRWIISELNSLIMKVTNYLEDYVSCEPARLIAEFVDSLSNWYVRRSRERFWASGETDDKTAAFTTLNYVLINLIKLMAPFVPEFTESIYQNLVRSVYSGAPISIHLCEYPKADKKLIDNKLNESMQTLLEIVVLGRSARNMSSMKNRQPLAEMVIASLKDLKLSKEMLELIKDELNIEKVELRKDAKEFLNYIVKPNLKTLGPKLGKTLGELRNYLLNADGTSLAEEALESGKIVVKLSGGEIEISKDDLLIEPISKPGYVADTANGITAILDTNLTEELIEKGNERELASKIQTQRKEAGFDVADHINIYIKASKNFEDFALKYKNQIMADTLADSLTVSASQGYEKENDINGEKVLVSIERVK